VSKISRQPVFIFIAFQFYGYFPALSYVRFFYVAELIMLLYSFSNVIPLQPLTWRIIWCSFIQISSVIYIEHTPTLIRGSGEVKIPTIVPKNLAPVERRVSPTTVVYNTVPPMI